MSEGSLAVAIILQAARDTRKGNRGMVIEAKHWLLTTGYEFAHAIGFTVSYARWQAWVINNCHSQHKEANQ